MIATEKNGKMLPVVNFLLFVPCACMASIPKATTTRIEKKNTSVDLSHTIEWFHGSGSKEQQVAFALDEHQLDFWF